MNETGLLFRPDDPRWKRCLVGCRPAAGLHRIDCPNASWGCSMAEQRNETALPLDDIDHNAECIRNALRKLGRFDRLDEDGTARAAGEALGFFVHKARKEGEHG